MIRTLASAGSAKCGHNSLVIGIVLAGVLFWFPLFVGGLIGYSGSKLIYTLFSVVFLAMLASGFYRQVSYGYLFLVVFLWLGFWLKLTVHMIFDYPYGEPIGSFDGTAAAWDGVLRVAIVASIGVVVGRLLYGLAGRKSTMLIPEGGLRAPVWYPVIRKWLWLSVLTATVGLAIVNAVYGILQIGLVPRTILLWPLNAAIAWMVSIGSAMGIATLLWWDISLRKNISLPVYAILAEALFSTISLLSRGVYIFHTIPQMLSLYKNRPILVRISRKKAILIAVAFVGLFVISISAVTILRNYSYSNVPLDFNSAKGLISSSQGVGAARFIVDRWIGLEGVMAVQSYPKKGGAIFLEAMTEKREIGKVTLYQEVCKSSYRYTDTSKWQFASLPGAAAFLYYSGSLWVVMLGMVAFALLVLFSENLIFVLTANPLLCTMYGLTAANNVAQFGIAPRQAGPYFFMIFCGILAIWFVQSRLFSGVLQKLALFRAATA